MNIALIVVAILGLAVFFIYRSYKKMKNMPMPEDSEFVKVLTTQNFENQIKKGLTLVDFWAAWCMPCRAMAPILNSIANELKDSASVGKLNIEDHQAIASKYQVRSIPTLILFKNGKEINRFVGIKTKDFLINQINKSK